MSDPIYPDRPLCKSVNKGTPCPLNYGHPGPHGHGDPWKPDDANHGELWPHELDDGHPHPAGYFNTD
ncbi:hypothetical protein LCGC14_1109820 [marine sediment metagenome]|uniref:Uncharacterized protein n=1 Tax=marine sediment metagenome TaxID=412755 RepID=A0A0F9QD79_9ZZZZ